MSKRAGWSVCFWSSFIRVHFSVGAWKFLTHVFFYVLLSIHVDGSGSTEVERAPFLAKPVRLTPAWEANNLPSDELNFRGMYSHCAFINVFQIQKCYPKFIYDFYEFVCICITDMTMDRAKMEINPPHDRFKLIFFILLLHGIGTLTPWNMFINAKPVNIHHSSRYERREFHRSNFVVCIRVRVPHYSFQYFIDYKLSFNYTNVKSEYDTNFLAYVGFAAQIPNVFFNWFNIFVNLGYEALILFRADKRDWNTIVFVFLHFSGSLTPRIVWSIIIEVIVFMVTVALAMLNSADWPGVFFWATMTSIVILNSKCHRCHSYHSRQSTANKIFSFQLSSNFVVAGGIYQNSVYGMAAKLPFKYTGAVVLGSNISGTLTSVISILTSFFASSVKTAAIYYFIGAMFVLLACFDTYFALPLNVSWSIGRHAPEEEYPLKLIWCISVYTAILSISRTYAWKRSQEKQDTWCSYPNPSTILVHFSKGISTIIQRILRIFHHIESVSECTIR